MYNCITKNTILKFDTPHLKSQEKIREKKQKKSLTDFYNKKGKVDCIIYFMAHEKQKTKIVSKMMLKCTRITVWK